MRLPCFPVCFVLAGVALACSPVIHGQVSGRVVEAGTQTPIVGARVTLQTTTTATETDVNGDFDLPGVGGANLTIVGAKKGFFHGVADNVNPPAAGLLIEMEPVPQVLDLGYEFNPNLCGFCHDAQQGQWAMSRMGNTGGNAWVYDLYSGTGTPGGMGGFVYTLDSMFSTSNPDGDCATCHQPVRWIKQGGEVPLSPDFLNDEEAQQGVSCDVCHKVADVDENFINTLGSNPLAVTYTLPGLNDGQIQYGVLGDVSFSDEFLMRPSLQPQLTSLMCAQCHQYFNDSDGDGEFDDFPGQTTYSEWASSPYADPQSGMFMNCVDCHTAGFGATEACDLIALNRDPETVHSMNIRGTTPEFLENSVTLSFNAEVVGNGIEVEASIFNEFAGHAVPTGVSIRNVILVIDALRREDGLRLNLTAGPTLHPLAGEGDPADGQYAGLPGRLFARINEDAMGNQGVIFSETVATENRRIAPLDTDLSNYTFELPATGGTIDVTARLIYRRAWRPLVDAKGWTQDGQGNLLEDLEPPHFGHLMESAEVLGMDAGPFIEPLFRRGDADADGNFNGLVDALRALNFQFVPGQPAPPCFDAADFDDDGGFNGLLDSLGILNFQFANGAPPPPPRLVCGIDPTPDPLGCGQYDSCP